MIHTIVGLDVDPAFVRLRPDDWEEQIRKSVQQCLGWRAIVRELEIKGIDGDIPSPYNKLVK